MDRIFEIKFVPVSRLNEGGLIDEMSTVPWPIVRFFGFEVFLLYGAVVIRRKDGPDIYVAPIFAIEISINKILFAVRPYLD